jgi:Rrf2 family protein
MLFWICSIQNMRMNAGVEWALHSCLNLTWAEPGETVTATKLAAFYDLPAAYLNKQLQALARAGIVASTSGPRGGFRLARRPEDITVLDVVTAIEGPEEAFRCTEILRQGPDGRAEVDYRRTCVVSVTMHRAELAWRRELAGRTIADLKAAVERQHPAVPEQTRSHLANL